jgi:molecular chaperone DnaJ
VKPDPKFRREGSHLITEVDLDFVQAALGDEILVTTIDGQSSMKVPAGTQPGTMFRLRGKGMPSLNGRGHGDLHVLVNVVVPEKLNSEQKRILGEFSRASGKTTGKKKPGRHKK